MDAARIKALTQTVIAGLPGRMVEAYSLAEFQAALDAYNAAKEKIWKSLHI